MSRESPASGVNCFGQTSIAMTSKPVRSLFVRIIFPISTNKIWTPRGGGFKRSPSYMAWRKEALWLLKAERINQIVRGPYKMTMRVSRPDAKRRDIDNLLKGISDVLVDAGLVEDDSLCEWIDAAWVPGCDACEILLESMDLFSDEVVDT